MSTKMNRERQRQWELHRDSDRQREGERVTHRPRKNTFLCFHCAWRDEMAWHANRTERNGMEWVIFVDLRVRWLWRRERDSDS